MPMLRLAGAITQKRPATQAGVRRVCPLATSTSLSGCRYAQMVCSALPYGLSALAERAFEQDGKVHT